jgi:transcription elongation factor
MSEHRFVNARPRDAASLEGRTCGNRPKFSGMGVPESPAVTADGCAGSAHDDDFGKGHRWNNIKQLANWRVGELVNWRIERRSRAVSTSPTHKVANSLNNEVSSHDPSRWIQNAEFLGPNAFWETLNPCEQ